MSSVPSPRGKWIFLPRLFGARQASAMDGFPILANFGEHFVMAEAGQLPVAEAIIGEPSSAVGHVAHLGIEHRDRGWRVLDHGVKKLFVFLQVLLGLLPFGQLGFCSKQGRPYQHRGQSQKDDDHPHVETTQKPDGCRAVLNAWREQTCPITQEKAETKGGADEGSNCSGPLAQQQAGHHYDDEVHRDPGRTDTPGRYRQCGHQRNKASGEQDRGQPRSTRPIDVEQSEAQAADEGR